MVSWPDAVDRITAADASMVLDQDRLRRPRLRATAVVTMGTSGAGKSELWASLTGRNSPRRPSPSKDEAYFRLPDRAVSSLFTVPGQTVAARRQAIEAVFGALANIEGLVFVATFGYDHTWPEDVNTVASVL